MQKPNLYQYGVKMLGAFTHCHADQAGRVFVHFKQGVLDVREKQRVLL